MTDETSAPANTTDVDAAAPAKRTTRRYSKPDLVSEPVDDISPGYAPAVVPGSRTELTNGLVIESF